MIVLERKEGYFRDTEPYYFDRPSAEQLRKEKENVRKERDLLRRQVVVSRMPPDHPQLLQNTVKEQRRK